MNLSMFMSKDEIIGLASRYLSKEEIVDFPFNGDLFAVMVRELPPNRVLKDDEGWMFSGYGYCLNYAIDEETKPRGKWVWMRFVNLREFPPIPETIRLQPPHIAKASFQNPERTQEMRFVKIEISSMNTQMYQAKKTKRSPSASASENNNGDNIIQFKKKN